MGCKSLFSGGVYEVKVVEVFFAAHFKNQLHGFVDHFGGSGIGAIHFIDNDNWFEACFERFTKHESSLGHWAFGGVDQQQCTVGHFQDAFDFTAKISVSGRVNDVNFDTFVRQGNILGENGNSAFFFDVSRIENSLALQLRFPKLATLTQQAIDESRFPMIDVGNDDDISNVFTLSHGIAFVFTLRVATAVDPKKASHNG